jgi:hypothetical protein
MSITSGKESNWCPSNIFSLLTCSIVVKVCPSVPCFVVLRTVAAVVFLFKSRIIMAEPPSIYFDSTYRLRVLEEEKFKDTERLQEECTMFSQSKCKRIRCALSLKRHELTDVVPEMLSFQETVQKLIEGMNKHASRIESAKLKALGQRNRSYRKLMNFSQVDLQD